MSNADLEKLLAELYMEIDDVYNLQAELELLEYLEVVGDEADLESEAA